MTTPTPEQLRSGCALVRSVESKLFDGDKMLNDVYRRASDGTHWLHHHCASDAHDAIVIQVVPVFGVDGVTVVGFHERAAADEARARAAHRAQAEIANAIEEERMHAEAARIEAINEAVREANKAGSI